MSIASLSYDINNSAPLGLTTIADASKMLADFGRNGDTYVVHAKEGETVIPMEVLDNNPRLKDMLFKQMRDLDLDPARYIVGNELNSINPITGQPEFFLKKLFKGLKKAVKKLAPIVLPIAAPFLLPTMPLFLSTGIGTLAGGLVGGQKPSDALRNAVIAGGLAGLGNMAFGQGGFGATGTQAGLTDRFDITKAFGGGETAPVVTEGTVGSLVPKQTPLQVGSDPTLSKKALLEQATQKTRTIVPKETGILDSLKEAGGKAKDLYKEYLSPTRKSIMPNNEDILKLAKETAESKYKAFEKLGVDLAKDKKQEILLEAFKEAKTTLAPGAFEKYLPLGATTVAGLYGLDQAGLPIFSVKEEEEDLPPPMTGIDLLRMDPDRFAFKNFYGTNPYFPRQVAEGGEIVGPGTPTSDSIPAMLSDGEFVMNAKAVRGAGGGDRKEGAKRMYAMMKRLEGVA